MEATGKTEENQFGGTAEEFGIWHSFTVFYLVLLLQIRLSFSLCLVMHLQTF